MKVLGRMAEGGGVAAF